MQRANLISPSIRAEITPSKVWDAFVAYRPLWLESATDTFAATGTLVVAAVPPLGEGKVEGAPVAPKVTRIEVDKRTKRVRAFGGDGKLTADYPASIGSSEKPAPDGSAKVTAVASPESGAQRMWTRPLSGLRHLRRRHRGFG